jgi:hypothetical protein
MTGSLPLVLALESWEGLSVHPLPKADFGAPGPFRAQYLLPNGIRWAGDPVMFLSLRGVPVIHRTLVLLLFVVNGFLS